MFGNSLKVMLLGLALIGGLAWYLVSPAYSLSQLREAALAGDKAELEERVDFPGLRESLKTELRAQLEAEMEKSGKGKDPFARMGSAIVMGMIDPMVEGLVSPEGIAALVAYGQVDSGGRPISGAKQKPLKWSIERDGLNRVLASPSTEGGDVSLWLVFDRDGWGWKLVGVDLDRQKPEE